MRLHATLLLVDLLLFLAAAPVPKERPPELTTEQVVGSWLYDWHNWPTGVISFDADGTYTSIFADHVNHGHVVWAGTWSVKGNVIILLDSSFNSTTGEKIGGPFEYRFDFGKTRPPHLAGQSTGGSCGDAKVALRRPNEK